MSYNRSFMITRKVTNILEADVAAVRLDDVRNTQHGQRLARRSLIEVESWFVERKVDESVLEQTLRREGVHEVRAVGRALEQLVDIQLVGRPLER